MAQLEKLKSVLLQEDTVQFVGSGLSLWAGLPSWTGLIEELAAFMETEGINGELVRAEAMRGDLLQAASYGLDKLTNYQFGRFIRQACRAGLAVPHEIHRLLVKLGPRCFVTTNYDDLIEQSLRKFLPEVYFKPVITNRQLSETADIVHARAKDFIFKPHGDLGDIDSIVLTREQYRRLLPQGDRYSALESLKILMSTRPVIYWGFGLRDPDFLYIRDLLANTYKGGIRDHYAVMADVSPEEIDYWRKNYGIHIISYKTIILPGGERSHLPLLDLVGSLQPENTRLVQVTHVETYDSQTLLSLARYASGLTRFAKSTSEFEILVKAKDKYGPNSPLEKFDLMPVNDFLYNGPDHALLVGYPGAGKTYALKSASAFLAAQLHEACLAEDFIETQILIPIYIDFKLYQGSIRDLVNQVLPPNLSLTFLANQYKLKIFGDSFNEMPREYWESGSYEADLLSFFQEYKNAKIAIGSRTSDGLAKLDYPTFFLDQIDQQTLNTILTAQNISFEGRFKTDVYKLLERPFYLQYILNGRVKLGKEAHPREFYEGFFDDAQSAFNRNFEDHLPLQTLLSTMAYRTLNRGEEVFPHIELLELFKSTINALPAHKINAESLLNWLISYDILIPYRGGRLAFVHQSITEYLAGRELAEQYRLDPGILREKLTLTRWDQALFMTLGILHETDAFNFLNSLLDADLSLALNASKYLEFNREEVVEQLLQAILDAKDSFYDVDWALAQPLKDNVPISVAHENGLRALLNFEESIAAAAAQRLIEILGAPVKNELLQLIFDRPDDFNFGSDIGNALTPFFEAGDLKKIRTWCDELDERLNTHDASGFIYGISGYIETAELKTIQKTLLDDKENAKGSIHMNIFTEILWRKSSNEALTIAADLLIKGTENIVIPISFLIEEEDNTLIPDFSIFSEKHIDHLLQLLVTGQNDETFTVLKIICANRPDLKLYLNSSVPAENHILKLAIDCIFGITKSEDILNFYRQILTMTNLEISLLPLGAITDLYPDWEGNTELFFSLLKLKNVKILNLITKSVYPYEIENLGIAHLDDIYWWLNWLATLDKAGDYGWSALKLGLILGKYTDEFTQKAFISIFNNDPDYREILSKYVLCDMPGITTDDLSEDAIRFLLAKLYKKDYMKGHRKDLLTGCSTESFIEERILPLKNRAEKDLSDNVQRLLVVLGKRYGKRYFIN